MKAVILAGGFGTRLQSVVSDLPKPMAPVGGKPFLEYLILQLQHWGFRDILLSVGYKADSIESYFASGARWDTRIEYIREDSPLGTGGGVREALGLVDSESFLLLNGDSFSDLDLAKLRSTHVESEDSGTIGLVHREDCSRYGRVEFGGDGRILSFVEKGTGGPGWIHCGVGMYRKDALLKRIPPVPCSLERDVLPRLVPNELGGYAERTFFIDIGVPEDYLSVRDFPERLKARKRERT